MSDNPPPYREAIKEETSSSNEGTSSRGIENVMGNLRTRSRDASPERPLIFVKTTMFNDSRCTQQVQAVRVHMDTEGLAFEKKKLFAYPKMIPWAIEDAVELVHITSNQDTTFRSLVNEIMPRMVCLADVKTACERAYKAAPVKIVHIWVCWAVIHGHLFILTAMSI